MLRLALAEFSSESVTFIAKDGVVPAVVGVPESTPVLLLMESQDGLLERLQE